MTSLALRHYIPRPRHNAVVRGRLQSLARRIFQHSLTLIVAPAGYGKTTLVSQWLTELRTPVAWLTCDSLISDDAAWWTAVLAALETVQLSTTPAAHAALDIAPSFAPEQWDTAIAARLAALPDGCLMVFDDLHAVLPTLIEEQLPRLLSALPPHVHVLLLTRAIPSLPLARLRARDAVCEVGEAALRFTREETTAFFQQSLDLDLNKRVVDQIAVQIEGWVAGLQLLGLVMQQRGDQPVDPFRAAPAALFPYFAEEVLADQPTEVQAFLQDIAIVPTVNQSLGEALTGTHTTQELLIQCHRENLFLATLDEAGSWYRLHPLFRSFLQQRLLPAHAQELHRRAAAWYRQHNMPDDALQQSLLGADEAGAIGIITDVADALLLNGQSSTVLRWIHTLPDGMGWQSSAILRVWAWVAALQGHWDETEASLLRMALLHPLPSLVEQGEHDAIRAFIASNQLQWADACALAQEALAILPTDHPMHTFTLLGLGLAAHMAGDQALAQTALGQAVTAARATRHLPMLLTSMGTMATIAAAQGHLVAAYALCQDAVRVYEAAKRPDTQQSPLIGLINLTRGEILLEWNDLTSAHYAIEQCLKEGERVGNVAAQAHAAIILERIWQAQGKAEEHPLLTATLAGEYPLVPSYIVTLVAAWRLRRAIIDCEDTAAGYWQRRLLSSLGPQPMKQGYEYLALARFHMFNGDIMAALALLDAMASKAVTPEHGSLLIEILLLQSLALRQRGKLPEAITSLARALTLAELGGYLRLFLDEGVPLAELLDLVPHLPVARQIARHFTSANATPSIAAQSILTVRERAVLQLVAQRLTNQEIAQQLVVTAGTIKTHLSNLYAKLGVGNRAQAVAFAQTLDLL